MIKNEIGNTYGRLTVLSASGSIDGKASWNCSCLCGKSKVVTGDSLRRGTVASCGCLQAESRGKANATHRMTKTVTYRTWQEMKTRCYDPSSISYENYGARGIGVCKRWMSFENFFKDMGVRPKGMSLDRVNNAKGYSPGNCKWASRIEQNRNKRNNVKVKYKGETKCLSEWCEILNLKYPRTYNRIVIQKLDPIKAFEAPPMRKS